MVAETGDLGTPFIKIVVSDAAGRFAQADEIINVEDEPGHDELFAALGELFNRFQQDGQIRFEYETELFAGRLGIRISKI